MANLLDKVIYKSAVMQQVRKELESFIKTASPILFWGEPGSGMGFYVRAIHETSREGKLLRKPCYELEEETVKNQLFGVNDQQGWLEEFNNGTIFFKRITQASSVIQETLLHLIEAQSVDGRIEFSRKASTETLLTNVRFVFSMAKDYNMAIQEKELYPALADIIKKRGKIVHLSPLRERKEDIVDIAKNFLDEFSQQYNHKVSFIVPKAQKLLTDYRWPGNIDELKRVLNNIFVEYPDITEISADHIQEQIEESKIAGGKFSFKLKGDEKFAGRILSKSFRIQKEDGSKFRIDTDNLAEIIRVEDTAFAPPRLKHFVFKLKDGSQLTGKILDKKTTVETSFNPNYQINPQNVYEVILS